MSDNPYYAPEKFNLTILGEVDFGGGYDFDLFVVWHDILGNLYVGGDSGCSCPSPFEDFTIEDLERTSLIKLQALLMERLEEKRSYGYRIHETDSWNVDIVNLIEKVRTYGHNRTTVRTNTA
jgi:hypothetical protein